MQFLNYGVFARNQQRVFSVSKDKVNELASDTEERAWCVVREGTKAVYLYGASGEHSILTSEDIGQFSSLHDLAAGKVILAHLPEEEVQAIIDQEGLPPVTDQTITDPEPLFDELEEIRDRGVAFNFQESMEGIHAIAAPVRYKDGRVAGALSIGGPANRLTEQRLKTELESSILGSANEVEINLRHE